MGSLLDNMSSISLKLNGAVPEEERPLKLVYVSQLRDGTAEARVRSRKSPYATRTFHIFEDFSITEVKKEA